LKKFDFKLQQINLVNNTGDSKEVIINEIKNEFKEVFEGKLGKYKLDKISLNMKNNAIPIFHKPRPLPFAWKTKVENELKELVKNDVLEPVDNAD